MVRFISTAAVLLIAAVLVGAACFIRSKNRGLVLFRKIASLALCAVAFSRYIYDQAPIYYVRGLGNSTSPFFSETSTGTFETVISILLVWFSYAALLTIALSAFFNYRTLRAVSAYFSLPVYIVITVFFDLYMTATVGAESYSLAAVRLWLTVIEIALAASLVATDSIQNGKATLPRTKKDITSFVGATIFFIISAMPCYVPQAFFEKIDDNIKLFDFTEEHRFMIYFAFVIPFILYHFIKNKPQDVKRFLMIYLTLALLWVYLGRWNLADLRNPLSWPLHLCNTAMFLFPLCLIFKLDRLFNFCLFINVMGAFLAMLLPNVIDGLNAIGTERVSFWLNHYAAFGMPVLFVALKIFKRPKFKEWVYATIALTVYFFAMLFVNAWFSNYGECDYFFLNSDFIVSSLGLWAERTMDLVVSFKLNGLTFTFYPIYQALFYVIYIGFTVGIWFIYELLFASWDAAEDRRLRERDYKRMKKELSSFLGKKPKSTPITGDDSPRLVLKNFSKRYGTNSHYSANNVSLDVKGGEIFGFLGPNGAGKSTIIKSIVGIQTITSGEIQICGYDVERQPEYAKLNTGFVPDHYALYENLTGREYINYIADLYSVTKEYRDEVIEKLLDRFQLKSSFDNQMKTYSHGMKQKITIMSALVHNPKVWILDEPLTGLDPNSIFEVKECMKEHAAKGNVVFFSSHIIDLVEKLCDRIAIIKKGQLRACTTIKELTDAGIELEQYYMNIINSTDDEHVPFALPKEKAREGAAV